MKIKKIISLLLSVLMLISCTNVVLAAEETTLSDAQIEACEMLVSIGFVNPDFTIEMIEAVEKVTRAEFAEMTHIIFGNGHTSGELYFHDVPAIHYASEAISALVELGILEVGEERLFRPSEYITREEAAKIIIYALGYGTYSEAVGVGQLAQNFKLYNGVKGTTTLSYADMVLMFYNALTVELPEIVGVEYGGVTMTGQGETFLSSYFDIYVDEGILTGYDGVSMYGDEVEEDTALIGDVEFKLEGLDVSEYLGRKIKFMYKVVDDEYILVSAKAVGRVSTLELKKYEDMVSYDEDDHTLTYCVGSQQRTIKLATNLNVIYNGYYVTDGVADILSDDFYSIKLVADKGKTYNLAIVEAYENFYLLSATGGGTSLYVKSTGENPITKNIEADDYDIVEVYDAYGAEVELTSIPSSNIISVFDSGNHKRLKIVSNASSVKGVISETEDDGRVVYVVDGEEYVPYSENLELNCSVGQNVTFSLDAYGYIADVKISATNTSFAYLLAVGRKEESFRDETLMFKIYSQDGKLQILEAAEKIKIDGDVFKNQVEDAYWEIVGAKGFTPTVVAYALDNEGKVKMLDLPASALDNPIKTEDDMLVKNLSTTLQYDMSMDRFGAKTRIDSSTVLFGIPEDALDAEERFFSLGNKTYFTDGTNYTFIGYTYNLDESHILDVLETNYDFNQVYWVSNYFLVDRVAQARNEYGDSVYKLSGWHAYDYKTVICSEECKDNTGLTSLGTLKRGDLISMSSSSFKGGELQRYTLNYSPSLDYWVGDSTAFSLSGVRRWHGYVHAVDNNSILVGYDSGADFDEVIKAPAKLLIYDKGRNSVREGTMTDLVTYKAAGDACSEIVVYIVNGEIRNFVVYE